MPRATVNQTTQFGLESTPGTNAAANKLLQCFGIKLGPMADVAPYTSIGRKYASIAIENSEWAEGTLDGVLDYNGIVYALSGVCGAATSIVATGGSATAKLWTFVPPLTGSVTPQTFTIEQGENNASGNAIYNHKVNYGLISEFGYKGNRKTGMTITGKIFAQALQKAITMTSSPTAVALQPSAGKHFNFYLDPTFGALGTTQLTDVLDVDFNFGNIYGMYFPFNRANLGFTSHVDLDPTCTIKLLLQANAQGLTPLSYLQAGSTQFLSIEGQGIVIDNNQTGTMSGGPTGGTFTLSYKGQTTAGIAYNATGATVNTAFQLLSTVGTNCTVSGAAGGPYTFAFSGLLATDTTAITANSAGLTGGTTPTLTITQTQVYAGLKHQLAVKVQKPNPFEDKDGVYAESWEFVVVEDSGWNKAHQFLVTTLLTAL